MSVRQGGRDGGPLAARPVRAPAGDPARPGARVLFLTGAGIVRVVSNALGAFVATLVLGAAERGVMVVGVSVGTVAALLGGLGSGTALKLRLPTTVDPGERARLVAAYTWWSVVAAGMAVVIATTVSALSANIIDPALSSTGFLVAVAVLATAQTLYWQTADAWFADGQFRRGGSSATFITAGGLVGLSAAATVSDSAAALLLAQGAGMVTAWSLLVRKIRAAGLLSLSRPDPPEIRALLTLGFPALGLGVGLMIALRADRYVLGAMAGTAAVGVYALAVSMTEVVRVLPQSMGQLFMRDTTLGAGRERLHRWLTLSVLAAAVGNGLVVLAGAYLIVPVFGVEFAGSRELLPILAVAEVCFAPYAVASQGLLGGGWTRAAGAVGVVGGVGSIACYTVFAGVAGATGIAVGCTIVYTGLSLAALLLLCRRLKRPRARARRDRRRAVDLVLACLALVFTLPLMAGVAVLIRCTLGRPVLFRQRRLGSRGREFAMLKFRTMHPSGYPGQPDCERVTRIGRVIRALSLDELPQFVNVVRGEMSVIGPRPGLPEHLRRYDQRQRDRLQVRPGLTGWAQVHGRNSVSLPERIELDIWYVEHRSWLVDLRILGATIAHLLWPWNVVGPGGANPEFPPEPGPSRS